MQGQGTPFDKLMELLFGYVIETYVAKVSDDINSTFKLSDNITFITDFLSLDNTLLFKIGYGPFKEGKQREFHCSFSPTKDQPGMVLLSEQYPGTSSSQWEAMTEGETILNLDELYEYKTAKKLVKDLIVGKNLDEVFLSYLKQ